MSDVENKSSVLIRSEISIGEDGIISGIGTSGVVVSNEKVDAAHIAQKVGVDSVDQLKNSNISISKDSNTITLDNGVTTHTATIEKSDIGLGSVENKSSNDIRSEITIIDGALTGIGTEGVIVSNEKVDATHIAQKVGVDSVEQLKNTNVSISKTGNTIILDNGVVVKEIAVPLERPRHRSQSAFGKLEEQVLDYLLAKPSSNSTLALTR